MNSKLTMQFTVLTFGIVIATWGLLAILGQFGITEIDYVWLFIPNLIGGLSPTIASYIALKKNKKVENFKEWLKVIFNAKIHVVHYLAVVALFAVYHILNRAFSVSADIPPLYIVPLIFLICFLSGGLEETGWRGILQPELENKFGFIISAFITGLIWFVWHLPLYFIPNVSESRINIWFFLFVCIMLSFLFGAFRKISGSVFLAVVAHTISNSMVGIFGEGVFLSTWAGVIGSTVVLSIGSIIAVFIYEKKQKTL